MLNLKVKPVCTAIGALAGAATGAWLAHQWGVTYQDMHFSEAVRALPYVTEIPGFAVGGGCVGYWLDKIREPRTYGRE